MRLELYGNETADMQALLATRRAYDVHVSASLVNNLDRNVTIMPLEEGLPVVMVGATRKPHPHYQSVTERLIHLEQIQPLVKMFSPKPVPAWKSDANATSACPRPLRLRLLPLGCDHKGCNGTHDHPTSQSVGLTYLDGQERAESLARARVLTGTSGYNNAWAHNRSEEAIDIMLAAASRPSLEQLDIGIDAIELEGRYADNSHPEYDDVEFSFEYEEEEEEAEEEEKEFEIPLEEITSLLAALATAAAGSEFVRKHVKPDEYAKMKAREGNKKDAQLARGGAEAAVTAIMKTPLEKINIEEAKKVIDEAEDASVLASMIDKLALRVQEAVELQLMHDS